jgi:hypothetical protein
MEHISIITCQIDAQATDTRQLMQRECVTRCAITRFLAQSTLHSWPRGLLVLFRHCFHIVSCHWLGTPTCMYLHMNRLDVEVAALPSIPSSLVTLFTYPSVGLLMDTCVR